MNYFRSHLISSLLSVAILLGMLGARLPGVLQHLEEERFEQWVSLADTLPDSEDPMQRLGWDRYHDAESMGTASLPEMPKMASLSFDADSRCSSISFEATHPTEVVQRGFATSLQLTDDQQPTFHTLPFLSGTAIGAP